jgi:hypothetical protein
LNSIRLQTALEAHKRLSEATATVAILDLSCAAWSSADRKQIRLELGTLRCNCVVIPFDDFAIAQEEHADPVPRLETEILEMVDALVENYGSSAEFVGNFRPTD